MNQPDASPVDPSTAPIATGRRGGISDWLGLIRFSHTIFALPFAALATVMALSTPLPTGDWPSLRLRDIIGILLCMVTARSAAMAFNRWADRKLDADNPRTAGRHLPAGIFSPAQVAWFTALCVLGFVASTLLFWPNWVPLAGSVPVILFLCGYSLAKRFTSAAHLWLGIALSLSPVCAWVAIRGPVSVTHPIDLVSPLVLALAVAAWVTGFDIVYACQDADFDRRTGLHSIPARFGMTGAFRIAAAFHIVMLVALFALPFVAASTPLGWTFLAGMAVVVVLVVRQHTLVNPDDLRRINEAFFQTNAMISLLILVVGVVDCLT
ncbi:4-hydroxybenzoate octaprenyltransferase [Crateriforma conspicua]|uniref:4-hydroxybenzoate octaprenyltransferase n=1 Tax=Crateriforma conspicua TaxID=2527996 RepID=UPI001189A040|nr:4-hydroxybenzoate octaprenyltransferase [Crateriforma conspicua]QDV65109.1 4-hydroxybenzoate octaprenyltransferase [Crateriforma conspicua]